MKQTFVLITAVFLVVTFAIPYHSFAQDSTLALKLNGHKHNQKEDLMVRAIQEWFVIAINSLDLPTLLDTLATVNGLDSITFEISEDVDVIYEVDESETYDFLTNIIVDTLNISAWGLGCQFDVDITGAGFVLRGVSDYESGELKIDLGEPDTIKPEISVVGTGHILCPGLADVFKSAMETEIDTLLIGLASMFGSEPFDNLLTFINPIQAFGLEDSVLIKQALQSFPMEMDLYSEYDSDQEIVQLIIEINFLMGTTDNPTAFVDVPVPVIPESQLESGGFSFLYWVLQRSFLWHEEWSESEKVDEALKITEEEGFKDFRIELRWSDLQRLAYRGGELDPGDISPGDIDGLVADIEHWDTTAFGTIEEYLDNGLTRNLKLFMALGVGHEDRMPLGVSELRIAPATEIWGPTEGYTPVSANEYLYNLKIYAHATVKRFADDIDVWQIENELNAAGFASADPAWWRKGDLWQNTDFRNQVWDILVNAVNSEDPTALIIHDLHMLGFMQGLEDWVDDMDIIGINFYPNQVTSLPVMGFTVGEYVWAVRRALIGLEYGDKPVWLTETGYPGIEIEDPPDGIMLANDIIYFSESRQEEYVETALQSAVDNGVSGFYYYSLVTQDDFPNEISEPMRFSGMIRRDTDAYKPALKTYADLFKSLFTTTGIGDEKEQLPMNASLYQNYPNPFNPKTIINYELPTTTNVELSIYNLLGQKVVTLISEKQNAGGYQVEWSANGFAGGIYFYRLRAGNFSDVKKMILLK